MMKPWQDSSFQCTLPCILKTCAVRAVLALVARELMAADLSKYPRGHAANASSGAQVEAPKRSWEPS